MALSLAKLARSLLFLSVLALAGKANGSDCKYCDKHNLFGFKYTLKCDGTKDLKNEECMVNCLIDCWKMCNKGRDARKNLDFGITTDEELRSATATFECPSEFGKGTVVGFLVLVSLGAPLLIAGFVLCCIAKRQGHNGTAQGMPIHGQYSVQQQQPAVQYPRYTGEPTGQSLSSAAV